MQSQKHEERRRHPRKSCSLAVKVFAWNTTLRTLARNISIGGVFIETPNPFAIDEEIILVFTPPGHKERIKAGRIAWNDPSGLAVAFKEAPDGLAEMIESLT